MKSGSGVLLILAIALGGCGDRAPTGQVVAVVNGEEVTRGELRAEAEADGSTEGRATTAQLQTVVDRKLWAQQARQKNLDKQVEFILSRRRAEDALLATLLAQALENDVPQPSDRDVDRFLTEHPTAFATNIIFDIDQIDFASGDDSTAIRDAERRPNLDVVEQGLLRDGVAFQRSRTQWNSLFMPPALVTKLNALTSGQVFSQQTGGRALIGVVVTRTATALDYRRRAIFAAKALRTRWLGAAKEQQMVQLRKAATIHYQDGAVTGK